MTRRVTPALFKPFSWLPAVLEMSHEAMFVADSMDAWRGVETCLGLVASSELARAHNSYADDGDDENPLLSVVDSERLLRLAIITAGTWELKCENHLQWMEKRAEEALSKQSPKGSAQ